MESGFSKSKANKIANSIKLQFSKVPEYYTAERTFLKASNIIKIYISDMI